MAASEMTALDLCYQIIVDDNPALEGTTFIGYTPDTAGMVRELTEQMEDPRQTMGEAPVALETTLVEIGVRGTPGDYAGPRNEALRLRYLIARVGQEYTYDGLRMLTVTPAGFRHLGRDSQRRQQFSILLECVTEPSE